MPDSNVDLDDWIEIGTVVAPQGLKGEVRVYPNTDFPERFEIPGQRWLLRPGALQPEPVQLVKSYLLPGKKLYIVQFAEVCDRNQSEAIRQSKVLVPISDRPHLEPGEFHVMDLMGLAVVLQETQVVIGRVVDLIPAGNDLLEVELLVEPGSEDKPAKVLIPFVEEIVPIVDLERQRLEILPPQGLLDLRVFQSSD